MSDALVVALVSGPAVLLLDRLLRWWLNRQQVNAVAGLTVDQRWQAWADELKTEVQELRDRVSVLERDLNAARERVKGLLAEVDHYRRIARSMARHVIRLRDAMGAAGVQTPILPTDIEDALTIIDLPDKSTL